MKKLCNLYNTFLLLLHWNMETWIIGAWLRPSPAGGRPWMASRLKKQTGSAANRPHLPSGIESSSVADPHNTICGSGSESCLSNKVDWEFFGQFQVSNLWPPWYKVSQQASSQHLQSLSLVRADNVQKPACSSWPSVILVLGDGSHRVLSSLPSSKHSEGR